MSDSKSFNTRKIEVGII